MTLNVITRSGPHNACVKHIHTCIMRSSVTLNVITRSGPHNACVKTHTHMHYEVQCDNKRDYEVQF